jgi:hypothetical protein
MHELTSPLWLELCAGLRREPVLEHLALVGAGACGVRACARARLEWTKRAPPRHVRGVRVGLGSGAPRSARPGHRPRLPCGGSPRPRGGRAGRRRPRGRAHPTCRRHRRAWSRRVARRLPGARALPVGADDPHHGGPRGDRRSRARERSRGARRRHRGRRRPRPAGDADHRTTTVTGVRRGVRADARACPRRASSAWRFYRSRRS